MEALKLFIPQRLPDYWSFIKMTMLLKLITLFSLRPKYILKWLELYFETLFSQNQRNYDVTWCDWHLSLTHKYTLRYKNCSVLFSCSNWLVHLLSILSRKYAIKLNCISHSTIRLSEDVPLGETIHSLLKVFVSNNFKFGFFFKFWSTILIGSHKNAQKLGLICLSGSTDQCDHV